MPLQYKIDLEIAPLPLDATSAAVISRGYAAGIAVAGSAAAAATTAIDALYGRAEAGTVGERSRLQRLYARVYTRAELERLMLSSFGELGLKD
jgi:hypothetical protein